MSVSAEERASQTGGYRAREIATIARWVASGVSGAVVGLPGCGRSNVLQHICRSPEDLRRHAPGPLRPTCLVELDLNDLLHHQLADVYRSLLHAIYWASARLPPALAVAAERTYRQHEAVTDWFVTQKAVYELLRTFREADLRLVVVLNRFDRFCEQAAPGTVNALRSLRDQFKTHVSYIVGMRQEVWFLQQQSLLGDMYELLDSHVCYVGAMSAEDAAGLLRGISRGAPRPPDDDDVRWMIELSGGFPSLLKYIGEWWLLAEGRPDRRDATAEQLLAAPPLQYRLKRMWGGLTQEEQLALHDLQRPAARQPQGAALATLGRLAAKGCCEQSGGRWSIRSRLLAQYVLQQAGDIRGRIWLDEATGVLHQGAAALESLTPLERSVLTFLVERPYVRHTWAAIVQGAWPDDQNPEYVTPNNLQVHISSIRKKIEIDHTDPRYLVTWNGKPGGYQFFPEGKPS